LFRNILNLNVLTRVSFQGGAGLRGGGLMAAKEDIDFAISDAQDDAAHGRVDEQQIGKKQQQKAGLKSLLAKQPQSVGSSDNLCCVCQEDKKAKRKYCDIHHRAYECIERAACKPAPGMEAKFEKLKKNKLAKSKAKAKKKPNKKGASSSSASSSSSTCHSKDLTTEHKAFRP
jgi:hypothetical protein